MGDVGDLLPPPYGLADNAESLLAVSDLVFVDPVSTGYSRAVEGGKPEPYHGFQGDLESVAEVIRLWTSRNNRWMSPKFLAGESYGTLRAAALAEHLQGRYGMYLNGRHAHLQRARPRLDRLREAAQRPGPRAVPADLRGGRRTSTGGTGRRGAAGPAHRGRGVCGARLPVGPVAGRPADRRRAGRGGHHDRPAVRAERGLRRPGRPADRAPAVLHRAAARPAAGRRPAGLPVHGAAPRARSRR